MLNIPLLTVYLLAFSEIKMNSGFKSSDWFEQTFGFREQRYENVRKQFALEENDTVLVSLANGRRFQIGSFTTPSLEALHERLNNLVEQSNHKSATNSVTENIASGSATSDNIGDIGLNCKGKESSGLKFQHLTEDVKKLHIDPKNVGAVFQVASQFNCLEMPNYHTTPDDGITDYENDRTQGPICAMSCSAGTVYRNYFINSYGQGGLEGKQIDCLEDMGAELGNTNDKYWIMQNGYALPSKLDSMKILKTKIDCGGMMARNAMYKLKVGVQWDTEVVNLKNKPNKDSHCVTQVFCSALPISYTTTKTKDFESFARLVLDSTYQSTFAVAAIKAFETNQRVNVYLTKIGGGAFGNQSQWIVDAIRKSIKKYEEFPLDVHLVHYRSLEQVYLEGLQGIK